MINLNNIIAKEIKDKYTLIPKEAFILGESRFNQRCHRNSADFAYKNNTTIIEVITINKKTNEVVLHYINKHKSANLYQDNTIGYEYLHWDYYFVKDIDFDPDSTNMNMVLTKALDDHLRDNLNWYQYAIAKLTRYRI